MSVRKGRITNTHSFYVYFLSQANVCPAASESVEATQRVSSISFLVITMLFKFQPAVLIMNK